MNNRVKKCWWMLAKKLNSITMWQESLWNWMCGSHDSISLLKFRFCLSHLHNLYHLTVAVFKEAHHYKPTRTAFQPVQIYAIRDQMKQMQAQQQGITLITIPFWWDRSPQRFELSSIHFILQLNISQCFSQFNCNHQNSTTWSFGEHWNFCSSHPSWNPTRFKAFYLFYRRDWGTYNIMFLASWNGSHWMVCFLINKTSRITKKWFHHRWMFEKYDGVRGFWNPHHKLFFSRTGRPFSIPAILTSTIPHLILDGELWYAITISCIAWMTPLKMQVWKKHVPGSHEISPPNGPHFHRLDQVSIWSVWCSYSSWCLWRTI
jgi:hypothetical protein